jgi:glycosyltransferase involved in cell wall biosynthesis
VSTPRASVVIPAHNEAAHLGPLLESLQAAATQCPLRVVVVCNGCTDATETIARSFDGVEVRVSEVAAKHAALNEGDDAAADVFPRLYLDGDVRVDPRSICELVAALDTDEARVVGPATRHDLTRSPWLARAFLRTRERLPFNELWQASHVQGRGVIGTSRAGRARFDRFPAIRSDDGFVDLLFDDEERRVLATATVELDGPTTIAALLRSQTRVVEGYRELLEWMQAHHPERPVRFEGDGGRGWRDAGLWRRSAFVQGLWHGSGALDAVGYVVVEVLTRTSARLGRSLGREIRWR